MGKWMILMVALSLVCPPIYATPVSNGNADDQDSDDVKELESLKKENIKSNSTSAEPSGVLQDASGLQPTAMPMTADEGERQSNSRSAIFRHRGITQAKKNKYWNEKAHQPSNDGYQKYAGIQYSPTDLAAYIFNTGDEEGVAVAVEELVREGMMGRTDAINYLQDVKQLLTYMRENLEHREIPEEYRNNGEFPKSQGSQRYSSVPRDQYVPQLDTMKRASVSPDAAPAPVVTTEHPNQAVIASTSEPKELPKTASTTARPKTDSSVADSYKEEDTKRHVPPRTSYGFTMDIIYKLAKDMFTQSIIRDDPTAETTLSGLVNYLESEVGNKRISPAMKEKVLEVVSAALVDSLREYQGLMPDNQLRTFDEGLLYQRLADANRPSIAKVPLFRKIDVKGHEEKHQMMSTSNR